jgi:hypothetical protein
VPFVTFVVGSTPYIRSILVCICHDVKTLEPTPDQTAKMRIKTSTPAPAIGRRCFSKEAESQLCDPGGTESVGTTNIQRSGVGGLQALWTNNTEEPTKDKSSRTTTKLRDAICHGCARLFTIHSIPSTCIHSFALMRHTFTKQQSVHRSAKEGSRASPKVKWERNHETGGTQSTSLEFLPEVVARSL